MNRTQFARSLLIITILYVIGFYFIGSAIKPGYSQWSNFISEYNATGTPWASALTYAGFGATAFLFSCFLVAAAPITRVSGVSRLGFWLLWSIPFSFFLGAIAPCDAGCPADGSTSQLWHNALSVLAYFGMGLGVVLVSWAPGFRSFWMRRVLVLLAGLAVPVIFVLMLQPDLAPWRGLIQRLGDVGLAIALILVSWTLIPTEMSARQDET